MATKKAEIGLVPEHWKVVPLVTYLERITYGFTNPMPDTEVGPWKITAKDVVDGYINYGTARHTSQDAFDNLLTEKSKPRVGDVLLTKDGSIGRVAVVDRNGICINQSVALLRPNEEILPFFLKYLLLTPHYQRVMERDSDGAVIKHIYITRVDKMQVAVPPTIDEQNQILDVIKTLDDKIELNRRMNETLEAIARAIFKSWFVDFDPVRAKVSGEPPESICYRLGLSPDLLALFPDRLVDSELGEIPEGWQVKPLDGIADYLNGLALQKFPPVNDSEWLPVIKISQLKKGDSVGADRASHKLKPEYIVDDGDVLFSWSGSLEVDIWCGGRGALNQHLFKATSENYPKWFYFYWTKHHLSHFQAIAAGKAVTMGHIQRKHLTEALCTVPPKALLERLDGITAPFLDKQIGNRKASGTLALVRDTLLPKLLSGELRVSEADSNIEACA